MSSAIISREWLSLGGVVIIRNLCCFLPLLLLLMRKVCGFAANSRPTIEFVTSKTMASTRLGPTADRNKISSQRSWPIRKQTRATLCKSHENTSKASVLSYPIIVLQRGCLLAITMNFWMHFSMAIAIIECVATRLLISIDIDWPLSAYWHQN